jgi:hypothetical protein
VEERREDFTMEHKRGSWEEAEKSATAWQKKTTGTV